MLLACPKDEHFSYFHTGCLYSKRDVLTCWSDLAFEFLVFWLSLVWSWVVEIYAWSTIWNYFDLRQPQQPQRKSVKIQSWIAHFLSKFWLVFFWFWARMAQYMLISTACLINWTICLAFAVFLLVFATLGKRIVEKDKNYFLKKLA